MGDGGEYNRMSAHQGETVSDRFSLNIGKKKLTSLARCESCNIICAEVMQKRCAVTARNLDQCRVCLPCISCGLSRCRIPGGITLSIRIGSLHRERIFRLRVFVAFAAKSEQAPIQTRQWAMRDSNKCYISQRNLTMAHCATQNTPHALQNPVSSTRAFRV